jgi:hypothetical protein
VRNAEGMFAGCPNLNQNIQIPNGITQMAAMFAGCFNLKQHIDIPRSVTNMQGTFSSCNNISGRINIYSASISNIQDCFDNTTSAKQVYIYYTYSNGAYTKTYNTCFNSRGIYKKNGVTLYNLGVYPQ